MGEGGDIKPVLDGLDKDEMLVSIIISAINWAENEAIFKVVP